MDDKETGHWWLRLLATLHTILGVILLILAVLAMVVAIGVANRADFYGALASSSLLLAGGLAVGGVATIGMGQAHKALADIADNSHCLPAILAQLRGTEPSPDADLDLPTTPTLTPTGSHRPCPKCGSLVFATKPICSECGTRVHFSRPA